MRVLKKLLVVSVDLSVWSVWVDWFEGLRRGVPEEEHRDDCLDVVSLVGKVDYRIASGPGD